MTNDMKRNKNVNTKFAPCKQQRRHLDKGFEDSLSIIIYVNDGNIVVNVVPEDCVGNSAVVFTHRVPHGGGAAKEGEAGAM